MQLPLASSVARHLVVLDEAGSTNAVLAERASTSEPFTVVVTMNQTAGRGRLGRTWTAPPATTFAASVLLPPPPLDRAGWLPLLAGLAMARAVRTLVPAQHDVGLKWPNDVQVDGLKVSGILAELVPGVGVVMGAGLNLTIAREQLPTETSTSLTLVGVEPEQLVDRALATYLRELFAAHAAWGEGLRDEVSAVCSTLGRRVRVELPGGEELVGVARAIDDDGRLVVDGRAVAAGDVTHLRLA